MEKQYWPAIILILVGVLLLLYQVDLIDFSKADIISYGFVILGGFLLINGFNRTDKKGIFGGVFFTSFGISMILMREYLLPRSDEFGFAAFFLALALANFVYLPFRKEKSTNLIWGIIFAAIGSLLLWAYFGYYPSWYVYEQIETYWPVILILIGGGIIYKAYRKKQDSVPIEG
jgi:hypothetical protein